MQTSPDVMGRCMQRHNLVQPNITVHRGADIRPCSPRQLPSHWLNNHSWGDFRDLGKQVLHYWMEWRFTPITLTVFLLVENSCLEGFTEALATG